MYNDAKKASNNKYLSKFKPISLRVLPEEEEEIRAAAEAAGESRHEYIVQAIRERMAGGRQTAEGFEAVELPAGYMDLARDAAGKDGAELGAWICKAIEKQAKADNDARALSELLRNRG